MTAQPTDPVLSDPITGQVADVPPLKPGWQTTEFWAVVLTTLFSLLAGFNVIGPNWAKDHEQMVNALAFLAATIAPSAYAIARAITKGKHQAAVAAVKQAQITSAAPAVPLAA